MRSIQSVTDVKQRFQEVFDRNEESVTVFGETTNIQLKIYLVENSGRVSAPPSLKGAWRPLEAPGWYAAEGLDEPDTLFLDASGKRVWRVFSLIHASDSDALVDGWLKGGRGLDACWLQRPQLMFWHGRPGWQERGYGIRFSDGLTPEEERAYFSLKAWYGANRVLPELQEVIGRAKDRFAITSVRWEQRVGESTSLLTECYSTGKITINRAEDVDDVVHLTSELSARYEQSLLDAEKARSTSLVPFELDFNQRIDLDAFTTVVSSGRGPMKLWLTEVEREEDFRSFKGVDTHTGDRVFLDLGPDYAYLSIPGKGCVNAAPRLAVIQGEDNAGLTRVIHDGVEVFA